MEKVRRIYVAKKPEYAVKSAELTEEIKSYLGIDGLKSVRIFIRYDVENVSDSQMQECLNQIVTSWEGENSKAYVNKGRIIQTRVKNLARELRNAADTIRDTANVIRNAELRNLEIASRRSF